ncbi:steroidogenic acute regulatory protein-like [Haematobia irritans]|uniref:steroidogenic acute regulatory protein-like n=1 Tax=Haematobia irritans TaxID=7368 RepID=UPI003F4F4380
MFSKLFVPSLAAIAVRKDSFKHYLPQQDEHYHQLGLDYVHQTYELLTANDWKVEKLTNAGDTVSSVHREKYGKVYKLTCRIKYPPKPLCKDFFNEIESLHSWNHTVEESKKIKKINLYTDITYSISAPCAGGLIKSRDFINLRCCRLFNNGKLCDEHFELNQSEQHKLNKWCLNKNSLNINAKENPTMQTRSILGNYLSAVGMTSTPDNNRMDLIANSALDNSMIKRNMVYQNTKSSDQFNGFDIDKENQYDMESLSDSMQPQRGLNQACNQERVWIIASSSVDYDKLPLTSRYVRAHNHISAFVIREIKGNPSECIVEWIACVDFRGSIPRYAVDMAFTTKMPDFACALRKHAKTLYQKNLNSLAETD